MRRIGITIAVLTLSLASVGAVAQAAGTVGPLTPVAVTPARGTPTATFTIRFTTPLATGFSPGFRSWEIASVADRSHRNPSCTAATAKRLPTAAAHARVSMTLASPTKHWCPGRYLGTITLYRSIVCKPGPPRHRAACPEIAFAPEPIGRFSFTVARSAS